MKHIYHNQHICSNLSRFWQYVTIGLLYNLLLFSNTPGFCSKTNGSENILNELTISEPSCSTGNYGNSSLIENDASKAYSSASQLASGKWIRVAISKSGIHKLTYADLVGMGLPVQGVSSSKIRVHGYAQGMLPEIAGLPRHDDLPENSIMMFDGGDGSFNSGDYILFYAGAPGTWNFNQVNNTYYFQPHLYSEKSYYFITVGESNGLRVKEQMRPETSTRQIGYYDHHDTYHPELVNLVKSGRSWFGDIFDLVTSKEYKFEPFQTEPGSMVYVRLSAAARSGYSSSFTLSANGNDFVMPVSSISYDPSTSYAGISTSLFPVLAPPTFESLKVKYNKAQSIDIGWLNFIEINAKAKLTYKGSQLPFRRFDATGSVEYLIDGLNEEFLLLDITNAIHPARISVPASAGVARFKAVADTLQQYIVAGASSYLTPEFVEVVENQNLHGLTTPQMLIIAPSEFAGEAIRLATFHASYDNLSVTVVQPQSIYNEFSSGVQDISAIRDFIKMLWHKAQSTNLPRYVLLFGDASYDYKNRMPNNTNIIPTFQSPESLNPTNSLATDDFFVSIDNHEGGNSTDRVDIGIGRLPVTTAEQARLAVDKIIHYVTDSEKVNGDWRNVIAFVADDGDGNVHMSQANSIATMIDTTYKAYNVDKIFLDSYNQLSTPGGQRSPEANGAINQRVQKGALIINYTGHGGETGWTHEQILEVKDINGWKNYNQLPVFMTATCEFSRYDDPARVSGGEHAFLNPAGGAIALFTTARPTYGTPNFALANNFYKIALTPLNGEMPSLGDIIRLAKNNSGADNNTKKFVLLGDPAMKMAYPKHKVSTISINNRDVQGKADTLKALQTITIAGMITGADGNPVTDFNGSMFPSVFDKESTVVTLGNEGDFPMIFNLRRNIIYKGKVEVINGYFNFSFIVPKDIAYNFGPGKISYYATDGNTDASGSYSNIIVGGIASEVLADNEGPGALLFINDTTFKAGGFTDENPVLLAFITDSSGVNTIGNSIGHDIVAILDNNTQEPFILNDYYQSEVNTYKTGTISFPLYGLAPGLHEIRLRVWDINNNSSEFSTHFFVSPGDQIAISDIEAWPNPMKDDIQFAIGHNQAGKELFTEFFIYDLAGNLVTSINKRIFTSGYWNQLWRWNGQASNGKNVSSGMYIGKLRVTSPEGTVANKSIKIVIAR